MTRTVGIVVFDDVEVLDFAGPFEVFTVAGALRSTTPFKAVLVGERGTPVTARGGLSVNPQATFVDGVEFDLILIPGGGGYAPDGTPLGTRRERENEILLAWIRDQADRVELTLGVCTGAFVLARAGLLDGLAATTHHLSIADLRLDAPNVRVLEGVRAVADGRVITSGGISAGIDMALGVVSMLEGPELASETADHMEYAWSGELPVTP